MHMTLNVQGKDHISLMMAIHLFIPHPSAPSVPLERGWVRDQRRAEQTASLSCCSSKGGAEQGEGNYVFF